MIVFAYYTPDFQPLADVTLPALRDYCVSHGYDLAVHLTHGKGIEFWRRRAKLALALLRETDVLFFIDLDAMITNHTIRLESFLDAGHDLFAAFDTNGLNAGVFLIRNTPEMERMMTYIIGHIGEPGVLGEQDAMRDALQSFRWGRRFKQLLHPSINSYLYEQYGAKKLHVEGQWEPGDFILHLPGIPNPRRIEILTSPEIQNAIVR